MAALTKQVNTHKEIEDTRRRWHGSRHGNIDSTTAINHRLTNTTAQSQAITSLRCTEEPAIGRLLLSLAPPAAVTVATGCCSTIDSHHHQVPPTQNFHSILLYYIK